MSKDKYYPQKYKCDHCGTIQDHYIWASQIDEERHECTNKDCKYPVGAYQAYAVQVNEAPVVGQKMTRQAIQKDRKKRSHENFQKEVYPTLSKKDRAHFDRKK